jgi:hypothetical protein
MISAAIPVDSLGLGSLRTNRALPRIDDQVEKVISGGSLSMNSKSRPIKALSEAFR